MDKGRLKQFVLWYIEQYGGEKTAELLERLKVLGFATATRAGISLGVEDLLIPPAKAHLMAQAEAESLTGWQQQGRGQVASMERYQRLIQIWNQTSESLKQEVVYYFENSHLLNPVYLMAFSGARGNISQVRQLVGMRGLMADPQGQVLDFPIRSNFREGLTLTEYLISCYGARKGIVDTALRTANAGYLTRRLVDVAQHVVVIRRDCGTDKGLAVSDWTEGNRTWMSLTQRLVGRVLSHDVTDGENLLAYRNQEVCGPVATLLAQHRRRVRVRSPLTCETRHGVCQLCYGWNLAESRLVALGEAVGVIAGQSIGEPGTQLTMRTFHTGGAFSGDVLEQMKAPYAGYVTFTRPVPGTLVRTSEGRVVFALKEEGRLELIPKTSTENLPTKQRGVAEGLLQRVMQYVLPVGSVLFVRHGQWVEAQQTLAQTWNTPVTVSQQLGAQPLNAAHSGEFYTGPLKAAYEFPVEIPDFTFATQEWSNNPKGSGAWILAGYVYDWPAYRGRWAEPGDRLAPGARLQTLDWCLPPGSPFQWHYQSPDTKSSHTSKICEATNSKFMGHQIWDVNLRQWRYGAGGYLANSTPHQWFFTHSFQHASLKRPQLQWFEGSFSDVQTSLRHTMYAHSQSRLVTLWTTTRSQPIDDLPIKALCTTPTTFQVVAKPGPQTFGLQPFRLLAKPSQQTFGLWVRVRGGQSNRLHFVHAPPTPCGSIRKFVRKNATTKKQLSNKATGYPSTNRTQPTNLGFDTKRPFASSLFNHKHCGQILDVQPRQQGWYLNTLAGLCENHGWLPVKRRTNSMTTNRTHQLFGPQTFRLLQRFMAERLCHPSGTHNPNNLLGGGPHPHKTTFCVTKGLLTTFCVNLNEGGNEGCDSKGLWQHLVMYPLFSNRQGSQHRTLKNNDSLGGWVVPAVTKGTRTQEILDVWHKPATKRRFVRVVGAVHKVEWPMNAVEAGQLTHMLDSMKSLSPSDRRDWQTYLIKAGPTDLTPKEILWTQRVDTKRRQQTEGLQIDDLLAKRSQQTFGLQPFRLLAKPSFVRVRVRVRVGPTTLNPVRTLQTLVRASMGRVKQALLRTTPSSRGLMAWAAHPSSTGCPKPLVCYEHDWVVCTSNLVALVPVHRSWQKVGAHDSVLGACENRPLYVEAVPGAAAGWRWPHRLQRLTRSTTRRTQSHQPPTNLRFVAKGFVTHTPSVGAQRDPQTKDNKPATKQGFVTKRSHTSKIFEATPQKVVAKKVSHKRNAGGNKPPTASQQNWVRQAYGRLRTAQPWCHWTHTESYKNWLATRQAPLHRTHSKSCVARLYGFYANKQRATSTNRRFVAQTSRLLPEVCGKRSLVVWHSFERKKETLGSGLSARIVQVKTSNPLSGFCWHLVMHGLALGLQTVPQIPMSASVRFFHPSLPTVFGRTHSYSKQEGELLRLQTYRSAQNQPPRGLLLTFKDQRAFSAPITDRRPWLAVGDFVMPGQRFTQKAAFPEGGRMIHVGIHTNHHVPNPSDTKPGQQIEGLCDQSDSFVPTSWFCTLRLGQALLLPPNALLHAIPGTLLTAQSPIVTLPFQRLEAGDIVQGIPKIEQYFEARSQRQGRNFRQSMPALLRALFERIRRRRFWPKAVRKSMYKIQQVLVYGVQRVYRSQGVNISEKHIEVIVRQMTDKARVVAGYQTGLIPGEYLRLTWLEAINERLWLPIRYYPSVRGISRVALETSSFLSAASFQHTARVLTRAALESRTDYLNGLKQNVMLGNLMPAGAGLLWRGAWPEGRILRRLTPAMMAAQLAKHAADAEKAKQAKKLAEEAANQNLLAKAAKSKDSQNVVSKKSSLTSAEVKKTKRAQKLKEGQQTEGLQIDDLLAKRRFVAATGRLPAKQDLLGQTTKSKDSQHTVSKKSSLTSAEAKKTKRAQKLKDG